MPPCSLGVKWISAAPAPAYEAETNTCGLFLMKSGDAPNHIRIADRIVGPEESPIRLDADDAATDHVDVLSRKACDIGHDRRDS